MNPDTLPEFHNDDDTKYNVIHQLQITAGSDNHFPCDGLLGRHHV